MPDSPNNIPDTTSQLFDNYIICLNKASIPEKLRHWYMSRAEEFIRAQNGRKIKSISGNDISQYFEAIGRQNRLSGWPFYLCIDAIRILYCDLLKSLPCQEVVWCQWKCAVIDRTPRGRKFRAFLKISGICSFVVGGLCLIVQTWMRERIRGQRTIFSNVVNLTIF